MELGKAKAIIKEISKTNSIKVQAAWDMLFFEEILYRLSISKYNKMFVFKGGLYLSSIIGIKNRSTMDMDFKLIGNEISANSLKKIFEEICSLNIESNIMFNIISISDIVAETKYGGKTIRMEASFFNIKKKFGIDIGFKDVVTPYPLGYQYQSIFSSNKYDILAYSIETIIAEKFETLISKGVKNSRSKDLYDLYILNKLDIRYDLLNSAIINTFSLRGTKYDSSIKDCLDEIFNYERIHILFDNYAKKNLFVNGVSFEMCKEAVYSIFSKLTFNEKINLKDYGIELHLVRHGQDEVDKIGGWSDNHLTVEGENQINHLISDIDDNYDIFISSDLNRAKESALIINEKLKMNIIYDSNYRETNNGKLKNLTKEEFEHKYPGLYFSSLDMNQRYPGGESPNEFYDRVKNAFMELLENNRNKKILLVTHGGVITVILSLLNGYKYNNNLKIAPKTASILKLK